MFDGNCEYTKSTNILRDGEQKNQSAFILDGHFYVTLFKKIFYCELTESQISLLSRLHSSPGTQRLWG